jgi:hypothetical protein
MKSSKIVDEERVIMLIITKNHSFFPRTGRSEKNLTIRKFSKRRKKQVQTLPTGRTTQRILVLVKGDRQKGSQISPTTQLILVMVKGDP